MVKSEHVRPLNVLLIYTQTNVSSVSGFVYRFVCTGSIEEKIFQRQASKQSLSASMIDTNALPSGDQLVFSAQDLRKLFLYKGHQTVCETHETFKCKRCKNGKQQIKSQAMLYGDPSTYVPSLLSELRYVMNELCSCNYLVL